MAAGQRSNTGAPTGAANESSDQNARGGRRDDRRGDRRDGRRGDAVLSGPGFGDQFLLAEESGQKAFPHAVVELVRAGMV